MKKLVVFMAIWVMAWVVTNMAFSGDKVAVSNLRVETLGTSDTAGEVYFRVTAYVENLGDGDRVSVNVQAIDKKGEEIYIVTLFGRVEPGESRELTTETYMSRETYRKIEKWQVMK